MKYAETVVALYEALKARDQCVSCGGKGFDYVWVGDDESGSCDAEPCQCSEIAVYVLERYLPQRKDALERFVLERGIDPDEAEGPDGADFLFDLLFSKVD